MTACLSSAIHLWHACCWLSGSSRCHRPVHHAASMARNLCYMLWCCLERHGTTDARRSSLISSRGPVCCSFLLLCQHFCWIQDEHSCTQNIILSFSSVSCTQHLPRHVSHCYLCLPGVKRQVAAVPQQPEWRLLGARVLHGMQAAR